ncbi:MAG: FliO/MopB family protein [Alphaproteobacteria bacterium]
MDLISTLRFIGAFAFVLALIAGLSWLLRRYGTGMRAAAGIGGSRIGVVEFASVDPKRRLALIRRDGVEHLILFSPTGETVIETGIQPIPDEKS